MENTEFNLQETWNKILPYIEKIVTQVTFDTVFKTTKPLSLENGILTLHVHKSFFKPTISIRYAKNIIQYLRSLCDEEINDIIAVSEEDFDGAHIKRELRVSRNYEKSNLRQKFLFETYVKGKCNELAYAAAQAVADGAGDGYNPLFLYGGVGLGKTHLVHAIGNHMIDINPELKVMYVSSETFTNEFILAIREQTTPAFKKKYREVDVLLIDDVQFLIGKIETQEELFHTFNELHTTSRQIVLTSDVPPKDLIGLEARLTSRFSAGLIADITMPDYETRTAILEKKLFIEQAEIPHVVKDFMINNIVSNIRDLEGAIHKVLAYSKLKNKTLTLEVAAAALKDQLVGQKKPDITVPYIQKVTSDHFKLTLEELCGKKRTQAIVVPRQIAMYLCRKMTDMSLPDLGKLFGGRDHTTVIHSFNKISAEIEMDEKLQITVEELESRIRGD